MQLTGNTLRDKQFGPFRLTEKCYAPDLKLGIHEHANAYVSLVVGGAYVETSRDDERACSSGTVIWHPRGETHTDHFHPSGGLVLNLEIDSAWLEDAALELDIARVARIYRGGIPYRFALRLYRALSNDEDTPHELATELVSFFLADAGDRQLPSWFRRSLEMASAIIPDSKLTLSMVAREVGIHPVHVARSFRHFTGCTFGDYVTQARMRGAFDLLLVRERSIAEIACECGFADHAHLCRTFKRETGLTPSEFRQNCKAALLIPADES